MLVNLLIIVVLIALAGLFAWTARRAWRSRNPLARWPGLVAAGLLALVFTAVTAVALLGYYRLTFAPHRYNNLAIQAGSAPEQIARGEKIAALCADCHSSTGKPPLDGSADNFLAGGLPLGVLYAPNLTPGGRLASWTDAQIARAIREGVDHRGRPLVVMPSQGLHALSDADVEAVIAFLRSQPAVDRDLPARSLSPVAALFIGSGMFPTSAQPAIAGPVVAPRRGTADYGRYMVDSGGCRDCHGADLAGMNTEVAFGPNLTIQVPNWSEEQFIHFFRTGVDPTGRQVSKDMPWQGYGGLYDDADLQDLYAYLHGLAPTVAKE